MDRLVALLLMFILSACGQKADPIKEYGAAKRCFEAALGYKTLSSDPVLASKYDELLKVTSTVIEQYEADAPDFFAKPGDAKKHAELVIQGKALTASTADEQAAILANFSTDAADCADRFQ